MSDVNEPKDKKRKKNEGGDEKENHELDDILGQLHESEGGEKTKPEKKEKESEESMSPKEEQKSDTNEEEGLEGILEKITEKEEEEPAEKLNFIERIIGIFTKPTQVFEYLRLKPDILTPIIITIIISLITSFLVYDIAINEQIVKYEQNDRIPDEQKERIIEGIEASKSGPRRIIYTTVFPILGVLVIFLVVSAIFLLIGNVLLGGKASFKKVLSVYGYSYLIVALLGTIIKLPLMLSKQTMKIDLSPAVFLGGTAEGTALHRFISSFDVFNIWYLIVFGIGMAIIYRFSQLKGVVSVLIAWLIYVVIFKVLLGGLLGGLTG